ncbi:uncharacterized protein K452DRAFT_235815 [Aplosporella prunicola CBS 121167]|uniref:Calcium-transporting ATPase 2 n=1 Tax=Aplosporella prunicola CBS 121167 TaxID=1176127 RepID=A0A6A6B2H9_9PEZI|nr:uncharacterized protein K452DRAFT_235815 [Aplosporella prunicola CBS 121167]KAF2137465.1 hypothetical protein K452DRAFT_235815 [Aplosporella prunicola CBS 121167]
MEDRITPVTAHDKRDSGTVTHQSFIAPFSLDPASEEEKVPGNKFAFSPAQLHRLITVRNLDALHCFGSLPGLAKGLKTDVKAGLSIDEDVLNGSISLEEALSPDSGSASQAVFEDVAATASSPGKFTDRRNTFGENRVPRRKAKTFLQLVWLAFNDKLMFLLTASATVSLALGIYQSISDTDGDSSIDWVEGVAIIVAIILIVLVTAINDYQKNFKFQKLNQKKDERMVTVTRSGQHHSISIFNILVGDILHVEAGDVMPADGILVEGFDIQCDESPLTGESDLIIKTPLDGTHAQHPGDPFILSGTRIETGVGTCLVVSVGANSTYGKIMLSLQDDIEETPLQQKLGVLAKYIVNFGLISGVIFFAIMFIRFLTELDDIRGGPKAKGHEFLEVFILSITVVVIGVPEGLPLTVTLALAFATTRMLKDKNLVRLLRSCEIMGNATTVCSDKTGTLTQNKMSVVAGIVGTSDEFTDGMPSALAPTSEKDLPRPTANRLMSSLSEDVRALLRMSFALNSTAIETGDRGKFLGSSTETALLRFASDNVAMSALSEERANGNVVEMVPFDSNRKWMAVIIRLGPGKYRMLVKGAAEVILAACSEALRGPQDGMSPAELTMDNAHALETAMLQYAERSLRVIAVAYRDFEDWPPHQDSSPHQEAAAANITDLENLVFIGAFGIRDPLRPEVVEAVRQCQSAGVFVRMVTGDNFFTAKAISSECGIYTAGGIAMDGPTFRTLTPEQLDLVIPRLQVLARSSPDDKMLLVSHLRGMNEIVAVTGDGTNDALALKAADVGFSMGISGTEVAKEASAIVLMDDNFTSIVKAVAWGRAVNDASKKFLQQFQFTINITAGLITVISALVGGTNASVFTVVQLLWINLIMDTFAALALGTDYPTQTLLSRKPEPRTASSLNTTMWKMVLGQSIYQLAVIFTFYYAGQTIFDYHTPRERKHLQTMTFNTYVLMQVFNQLK